MSDAWDNEFYSFSSPWVYKIKSSPWARCSYGKRGKHVAVKVTHFFCSTKKSSAFLVSFYIAYHFPVINRTLLSHVSPFSCTTSAELFYCENTCPSQFWQCRLTVIGMSWKYSLYCKRLTYFSVQLYLVVLCCIHDRNIKMVAVRQNRGKNKATYNAYYPLFFTVCLLLVLYKKTIIRVLWSVLC